MDILGLASDLSWVDGDCEAESQDLADIRRYVREARCVIRALNPEFYAEKKTFALGAGSIHDICTCDQITSVLGQTSADCTILESSKFPQAWGCKDDSAFADEDGEVFKLTNIDVGKGFLIVQPPVPEGAEVNVTLMCVPTLANADEEPDINSCADVAALSQWALFRAVLARSDGDAASHNTATLHLRVFSELVGIRFRALQTYIDRLKTDEETDQ